MAQYSEHQKKLPSENGTYSREENIVTCSFPDSQEMITLLVYDGILYCGDSVFQKDRTSIAKEIAQRQFENELTGYGASNSFQSNDATFQDDAQLKITGMTLHHEGLYLIAEGSVKNTGTKTRTFIKVKCSFKDASENVIDTDDTYACGSEGLAPNESTKFKVYIDYDQRIQSVSAYIYDFS